MLLRGRRLREVIKIKVTENRTVQVEHDALSTDFETKLNLLCQVLAIGEDQLDNGEGVDGEAFMNEILG